MTAAGWHPDPYGRYEQRYWDGQRWTEHVSRGGQSLVDAGPPPPVAPPAVAQPAVVQPPVVQPPVMQPPVMQPPVVQPPGAAMQAPRSAVPSAPAAPSSSGGASKKALYGGIAAAVAVVGVLAFVLLRDDSSAGGAVSTSAAVAKLQAISDLAYAADPGRSADDDLSGTGECPLGTFVQNDRWIAEAPGVIACDGDDYDMIVGLSSDARVDMSNELFRGDLVRDNDVVAQADVGYGGGTLSTWCGAGEDEDESGFVAPSEDGARCAAGWTDGTMIVIIVDRRSDETSAEIAGAFLRQHLGQIVAGVAGVDTSAIEY